MSSELRVDGGVGALDVVGHAVARRALLAAIARDALPPALMLSGESGIGKWRLARWLTAVRWCGAAETRPCGTCASCRKVAVGQHPDLHVIVRNPDRTQDPQELGSRHEITVDQIRFGLLPVLALRAVEGRGRVAILDDAESLNEAAQNALLKTLEEPPPGVLLLLLCSHEEALLDTVRSRCQSVRLAPLTPPEMERLFPGRDTRLLTLAAGRPGRVETLVGLDVHALSALLTRTLQGEITGTAFARAVAALLAARQAQSEELQGAREHDSGRGERAAIRERAADREHGVDRRERTAERDVDAEHRLVADLLLHCWREIAVSTQASAPELQRVSAALLELPGDLARHIPPSVAWTAAGLALSRAHWIADVVGAAGRSPHS